MTVTFDNDAAAVFSIANSCADKIKKDIFETSGAEDKYYINLIQIYATAYSLALILYMLSQTKQKSELKLLTKDILLKWHYINSGKLEADFTRHLDKKLQQRIKETRSVFAKFESINQSAINNPIRAISKGFLSSISKDNSVLPGEETIADVFLSFHELIITTAETFPNGKFQSSFSNDQIKKDDISKEIFESYSVISDYEKIKPIKKFSLLGVLFGSLIIMLIACIWGVPSAIYNVVYNSISSLYSVSDFLLITISSCAVFFVCFVPAYVFSSWMYFDTCETYISSQERDITNYKEKMEGENKESIQQRKKELENDSRNYVEALSKKKLEFEQHSQDLVIKENFQNTLWNEKIQSYPWLANQYADYIYIFDKQIAVELKNKSHPALKASDNVLKISKEKRNLQALCKLYQYQLNYYETVFPWLESFKEIDPIEAWNITKSIDDSQEDEYSLLNKWLSPDEYTQLSTQEKYQLSFDRYSKRQKTNWEIGIEYERYVGYIYENKGYKVKFNGALSGLTDMGRDLIAYKRNDALVIQCKYWSKEKTIHEKHIFQLYGTTVLLRIENPNINFKPLFVTTTKLSETARQCAKFLDMVVVENYSMEAYPQIKCNISANGEKIYHLPFDQQYDNVIITPNKGDCYVSTVKEAEDLGFRHAYRWQGF